VTKRKKFIISSVVLSLGLLGIQLVSLEARFLAIVLFGVVTYGVSAWALFEDLKGIEWFTILSLPSFYAIAVGMFYFLLPESTLSRLVILFLFGLGMYALYLTENIYSVAAIRTIQLLRAAHAVGFLMTILTSILLFNFIYSLKESFWVNASLVFLVSFPIMLQALWSIKLTRKLPFDVIIMAAGMAVVLSQIGMILSLLPVTVWIASLFLGTVVYVSLGLLQHALSERLFTRTIYEYVGVGVFVLGATLLVTPWK
jgi:hypothetical protein